MKKSIFENTMVDMSFPQLEEALRKQASILLPISVVEEHGPHLCTGVDVYLTSIVCDKVNMRLKEAGIDTIIAPPFYWGVNSITNGFIGSFQIKKETTEQLLIEIVQNFVNWGFQKIFLLSFHGDFKHMKAVADATLRMQEFKDSQICYLAQEGTFDRLGYQSGLSCLVPISLNSKIVTIEPDYFDIHAGAAETSWMALYYEDLVDIDSAQKLPPTNLTITDMKEWIKGGDTAKSLTPLGYCGNPANIQLKKIQLAENEIVEKYSLGIMECLRHKGSH